MTKREAISIIYENLQKGNEYGYFDGLNDKKYFNTVLLKHWCKNIFVWRHFGSSANKATKQELEWIIEVIFKMKPQEFLQKYKCVKETMEFITDAQTGEILLKYD